MFIFHEKEFDLFKLFGGQSPKIRVRVFPVFDCDQKLQNFGNNAKTEEG